MPTSSVITPKRHYPDTDPSLRNSKTCKSELEKTILKHDTEFTLFTK